MVKEKFKNIYLIWPLWVIGWILVFLGVDTPIFVLRSLHIPTLWILIGMNLWATFFLTFQFVFWRWILVRAIKAEFFQQDVELSKTFRQCFHEHGLIGMVKRMVKHYTIKHFQWAVSNENFIARFPQARYSYLIVFAIAIIPIQCFRGSQVILCALRNWRLGFIAIALGNITKVSLSVFFIYKFGMKYIIISYAVMLVWPAYQWLKSTFQKLMRK